MTVPAVSGQLEQARQHLSDAVAAMRTAETELAVAQALVQQSLEGGQQGLASLIAQGREQLTRTARIT